MTNKDQHPAILYKYIDTTGGLSMLQKEEYGSGEQAFWMTLTIVTFRTNVRENTRNLVCPLT